MEILYTLYKYMNVYFFEDKGVRRYCIGARESSDYTCFHLVMLNREDIGKGVQHLHRRVQESKYLGDNETKLSWEIQELGYSHYSHDDMVDLRGISHGRFGRYKSW